MASEDEINDLEQPREEASGSSSQRSPLDPAFIRLIAIEAAKFMSELLLRNNRKSRTASRTQ